MLQSWYLQQKENYKCAIYQFKKCYEVLCNNCESIYFQTVDRKVKSSCHFLSGCGLINLTSKFTRDYDCKILSLHYYYLDSNIPTINHISMHNTWKSSNGLLTECLWCTQANKSLRIGQNPCFRDFIPVSKRLNKAISRIILIKGYLKRKIKTVGYQEAYD